MIALLPLLLSKEFGHLRLSTQHSFIMAASSNITYHELRCVYRKRTRVMEPEWREREWGVAVKCTSRKCFHKLDSGITSKQWHLRQS